MRIDELLSRLQNVKRYGSSWRACCPAHEDRTPSLSVSEGEDGRILLNCLAACPPEDVLDALSITFADLFPNSKPILNRSRGKQHLNPWDVLESVSFDALIVATAADDLSKGRALSEVDHESVTAAAVRIRAAIGEAHAKR